MTCIIVDDEPLAREGLEMKVAKMGFLELLGQFFNGMDANRLRHGLHIAGREGQTVTLGEVGGHARAPSHWPP